MDDEQQILSGPDVVAQIRRALASEIQVLLDRADWSWEIAYAGDVGFWFGDWKIVFFNDCDDLDYCDSAEAPDGRRAEFIDWRDANEEPTALLSLGELGALETLLAGVTAARAG
jgi:hypothetical protein